MMVNVDNAVVIFSIFYLLREKSDVMKCQSHSAKTKMRGILVTPHMAINQHGGVSDRSALC